METIQEIYLQDRKDWHRWLDENYGTKKGVWLIFYKAHTGKPSIPYEDAVEEALSYGWIDSIIKKVDEERYARKFTPRKPHSKWSDSNIVRIEKMIREGRISKQGLLMVEQLKINGEFFLTTPPPKEIDPPKFFMDALCENDVALRNFKKLSKSNRRQYVAWLLNAKKDETRKRRLSELLALLEKNEKLGLK
jgi:uncharacterized protein YdeI (YjbR/CyaY-like superfamily)